MCMQLLYRLCRTNRRSHLYRCLWLLSWCILAPYYTCSVDINECMLNTSGCSQGCMNNDGSFECTCSEGFTLSSDGVTCTLIPTTVSTSTNSTVSSTFSYLTDSSTDDLRSSTLNIKSKVCVLSNRCL